MKYNPDFKNLSAINSGFDSTDPRPHLRNLLVFQHYLMGNMLNGMEEVETWDDVIASVEHELAFFKSFHCFCYE